MIRVTPNVASALGLMALGCSIGGSSPASDFYVLYAHEGPVLEGPALKVELRRPGLPDHLNRPQIVRNVENGQLQISDGKRWGAALPEMVGSILASDLSRRLPRSEVYTESGAVSVRPDAWVEVDLRQFEQSAAGDVVLHAQVAVHWHGAATTGVIEHFEIRGRPADGTTAELVATMSELLGELADAIAQLLSSGPPPGSAARAANHATR